MELTRSLVDESGCLTVLWHLSPPSSCQTEAWEQVTSLKVVSLWDLTSFKYSSVDICVVLLIEKTYNRIWKYYVSLTASQLLYSSQLQGCYILVNSV